MSNKPATRPWRPLRALDIGAPCVASPSAGTHYVGVVYAIYTEGVDAGLVDVRYDDGALGAWPAGRVSLLA